jgi:1-deoxy-D-xylulose-5-phosphate reductoisomerase
VHSLVEFIDGSILAQISVTDMRLPILYALAYPDRVDAQAAEPPLTFDLAALSQLDFAPPDFARFPCLRLAYEAAESGPAACIALNAADEIAVAAFLDGQLSFNGIPRTIEQVLALTISGSPASIPEVLASDLLAREQARELVAASQSLHSQ